MITIKKHHKNLKNTASGYKMSIDERSYSGQLFRPRPEVHLEGDGQLMIVATPWGPRNSAKKVIRVIQDYFLSARQDKEATSPFAKLSCLSPLANDLRIAVRLANDAIYNEENKNEYISGVELLVVAKTQDEVAWVQVGYPYLFLDRPQKPLVSLGSQQDLSVEFSLGPNTLAPLPLKLLGLEPFSDFSVESIRPSPHDRFIFISRSGVPPEILSLSPGDRNLENISKLLSQDDAEIPFWVGIHTIKAA
jgi:hypothetical protein